MIREQIAQDSEPLREVINSKGFKENFGGLTGEQLKTAPKGFPKDHPEIDLLRHKQFLVSKDFTDLEAMEDGHVKCLDCNFIYSTWKLARAHYRHMHISAQNGSNFKCKICNEEFSTKLKWQVLHF